MPAALPGSLVSRATVVGCAKAMAVSFANCSSESRGLVKNKAQHAEKTLPSCLCVGPAAAWRTRPRLSKTRVALAADNELHRGELERVYFAY